VLLAQLSVMDFLVVLVAEALVKILEQEAQQHNLHLVVLQVMDLLAVMVVQMILESAVVVVVPAAAELQVPQVAVQVLVTAVQV
jgi:hypothetical protein